MSRRLVVLLSSGFYAGLSPVASGTAGTLVAVPIALLFGRIPGWVSLGATAALIAAACSLAGRAETVFGQKDSGKIVIDEIAGYLVAMLFFPPTPRSLAAAFLLFRFFDVVKPFPAGRAERALQGGVAVVMDDVVAGAYANICMWGLTWLGWLAAARP